MNQMTLNECKVKFEQDFAKAYAAGVCKTPWHALHWFCGESGIPEDKRVEKTRILLIRFNDFCLRNAWKRSWENAIRWFYEKGM